MSKETEKTKLIRNTAAVCIVACILIIGMLVSGTYLNNRVFLERETEGEAAEVGINSTLQQISYLTESAKLQSEQTAQAEVDLKALSIRDLPAEDLLNDNSDEDSLTFVVRTEGDTIVYPEDMEIIPELTAEMLRTRHGTVEATEDDLEYIVAFSRIRKNYYMVEKYYIDDQNTFLKIAAVESAYAGMAVVLDEKGRAIYCNPELGELDFKGEDGLDQQALDDYIHEAEPYCLMSQLNDKSYTMLIVMSRDEVISDSLNIGLLVSLITAILMGALIVWIAEIKKLLLSRNISDEERHKFHPAIIKRKIVTLCILGSVFIYLISVFAHSIGTLYTVTWDAQNALSVVDDTLEYMGDTTDYSMSVVERRRIGHASMVAGFLSREPQTHTRKQLGKYREILSANYLMLYDQDGNEIISDSAYINKHIDSKPDSETFELTKVLEGEEYVYIKDVTDNVTGEKSDLIGLRLAPADGETGYEMLVVSLEPSSKTAKPLLSEIEDMLMLFVSSYDGYILLDEDKKIAFMSNRSLYMMDPLELGMKEDQVRANFMGEFTLDNESLYGLSKGIEGKIVYYFVPSSILYNGAFKFGFAEVIWFIIIMTIVCLLQLKDYDRIYAEGPDEDAEEYDPVWGGRTGIASRLPFIRSADTPGKRAKAIFNILGGIAILIIAVMALSSAGGERRNNLIPYIFSDYWNRGINLFAIARVLILICGVIIAWGIISFLIGTVCNLLDTKGVTVVRLLKSVLSYAVTLATAYYSALYLGFDPATLLASVGIIGLALSLGAQDIIKDLFAGISLVFEKAFHVGDVVEIDGIKGTVIELGARTLKLIGEDNNLKIIRNSDIKKISNLSSQHKDESK